MEAAANVQKEGIKVFPEIMIPLVVNVREIRIITEVIDRGIREVFAEKGVSIPYRVGNREVIHS